MKSVLKIKVFAVALIASLILPSCNKAEKDQKKPNIIFFMVDDMGWMDSDVYGSEYYETPNMQRLAKMGVTFTNAYAANPLCSPTRASILTGRYPARYNLTTPAGHLPPNPDVKLMPEKGPAWQKVACPGERHYLPLEEITIAESLKKAVTLLEWASR